MPKASRRVTENFFAQLNMSNWAYNTADIRRYLDAHPDLIEKRDVRGRTALHVAAILNETSVVRLLLERGADPNKKAKYPSGYNYDNDYRTPLYTAVARGNLEVATMLLEHGAKVDVTDGRNETPLMCAVRKHNQEMVDLLLRYKASPHKECGRYPGTTSLHMAVQNHPASRIQMVSSLLRSGGRHQNDGDGVTPIALAARYDCLETFKLLIFNSSRDDAVGITHDFSRWSKIKRGFLAREDYTIGPTVAAYIEKLEVYGQMLPFLTSCKGNYALLSDEVPVRDAYPNRIGPLGALLVCRVMDGVGLNAIDSCREVYEDMRHYKDLVDNNCTTLMDHLDETVAVERGQLQVVQRSEEESVLHYAAGNDGSLLLTVLALQEGADVNARNAAGDTPLGVVSRRISGGDDSKENRHIWDLLKIFKAASVGVMPERFEGTLERYYDIAIKLDEVSEADTKDAAWQEVVTQRGSDLGYDAAVRAATGGR